MLLCESGRLVVMARGAAAATATVVVVTGHFDLCVLG